MKLFATLTILAIAPALFAGEPVSNPYKLPVSYTGTDLACLTGKGALTLSVPLSVIREYRNTQDPQPNQSFGFAGYYSFCSKTPCAIVMTRIGGVTNILGSGLNPDVSLFTGPGIDGIIRGGGSVTISWTPKGSNLSLILGAGADWPMTDFEIRKVGVGVIAGFRYDVRF